MLSSAVSFSDGLGLVHAVAARRLPMSSQSLLFFACGCTPILAIARVAVEPFIGRWCHTTFPAQHLGGINGDMEAIAPHGAHVAVEPAVGRWCFSQYRDMLAVIDEVGAIANLSTTHADLEPFLAAWGAQHPITHQEDIEPHFGDWCAAQWPTAFDNDTAVSLQQIPVEPYLGGWCFDQFPAEMSAVNRTAAEVHLFHHHAPVEDELLRWSMAARRLGALADGASSEDFDDAAAHPGSLAHDRQGFRCAHELRQLPADRSIYRRQDNDPCKPRSGSNTAHASLLSSLVAHLAFDPSRGQGASWASRRATWTRSAPTVRRRCTMVWARR